jgi:hypothetical protein
MAKKDQKDLGKALREVFGWREKIHCWIDASDKVVASVPFRPESYLPDAHILLEAIRGSGEFCCIKIFSDYNYVWEMSLTPSGWLKNKRKFKDPDEHKEAIFAQADTFPELITQCLFKIQEYNALNSKS